MLDNPKIPSEQDDIRKTHNFAFDVVGMGSCLLFCLLRLVISGICFYKKLLLDSQ